MNYAMDQLLAKKNNFIKSGELKKKLDDQKVKAIKGINVYIFFNK